jgi:hypothetical protein
LQGIIFLIRIRIVAILPLISIAITGSQVNPPKFSGGLSLLPGAVNGIAIVAFVTFILVVPHAPWNPEIQFVICVIVVSQDVWLSAFELRFPKRLLGG